MAADYIPMDTRTPDGGRVAQCLRAVREGRAILGQELAVMGRTIDGNGSDPAQFTLTATVYGFTAGQYASANAAAKAAWDELNSLYAKLTAASGDFTGVAIDQCCAKLGV